VTGCRKFPIGKAAGRNASEPRCSLVNDCEEADPVDVWGRPMPEGSENGSGLGVFRGSRGGMLRKINSPVLEAPCSDAGGVSTGAYKETKSQRAALGVGGVHITD